MSSTEELAQRVARLEEEVADLKRELADALEPADALEAAFDRFREAVKVKRRRQSLRRS